MPLFDLCPGRRVMTKSNFRRRKVVGRLAKPGTAPGTLIADPAAPKPVVSLIAYGGADLLELELKTTDDLDRLPQVVEKYAVTWINVDGLGDLNLIRRLGQIF